MKMEKCKSCDAEIFWCQTSLGKWMPIDWKPMSDGNIIILDGRAIVCTNKEIMPTQPRYTSHFATCRDADKHRRK